jgi:CheY-like chemotaxis protein
MIPAADLPVPRILAVDDECQIHASLRLRLSERYQLISCFDPHTALSKVQNEYFDLCIVDLHMPGIDGLAFVEAARQIDPALGFVVLSGYGTEENLRRVIPFQIYDFIFKPLVDRSSLEKQLPDWVQRTRQRRQELVLVNNSGSLERELHAAQIERDIEFTASESARDALLQSANLLTTIHALIISAGHQLISRSKNDPASAALFRTIQEARKAADAATTVTEGFFNSAYANRDSSPAHLGSGLVHAASISARWAQAEQHGNHLDIQCSDENAIIAGLSGIELLLLLIPALGAALEIAGRDTTVQVRAEGMANLNAAHKDPGARDVLWVNRKHALHSHAGMSIRISTSSPALEEASIKRWLEGDEASRIKVPVRGLLHGLRKCKGMLGFTVVPHHARFELRIVLPT